MVTVTFQGTWW